MPLKVRGSGSVILGPDLWMCIGFLSLNNQTHAQSLPVDS